MTDWCPENDGAHRMELAEMHRRNNQKTTLESAAPDLYEALVECVDDLEEISNAPAKAFAALAKARGE